MKNAEIRVWETNSLEEHVALIQEMVKVSLEDPETRKLAVGVVGRRVDQVVEGAPCVHAWDDVYRLGPQRRCPMNDGACELEAIWNFVVLNIRYVYDPDGFDLFLSLKRMLEARAEDCDGFTIAFGSMLRAVGFQNVFARVVSVGGKQWEHVYTVVGLPKQGPIQQLVPLDPTVEGARPGWEYPGATKVRDFRL